MCQASSGFMHGNRRHIGSGCHCRNRQIVTKVKVCAVSLIHQRQHSGFMDNFHDLPEIGGDPVIGRIVDKNRLCLGMLPDRLLHLCNLHTGRNANGRIDLYRHIDRDTAAEYQSIDDALMHVSRQDNFISGTDSR